MGARGWLLGARSGLWFPGLTSEPSPGQRQCSWYTWAHPRRSPAAASWIPLTGFFSPPFLSRPTKGSHFFSLFPCPVPHSSQFCKFYSPLGPHFSISGKCQDPTGVTRKWVGDVRKGQGERRAHLGSEKAAWWHTATPKETWVLAQPLF